MASVELNINAPNGAYRVVIGDGASAEMPERLRMLEPTSLMLVSDGNVMPAHGKALAAAIEKSAPLKTAMVPAGEGAKSLDLLIRLYDVALADPVLDRGSVVVALGGGVVGDLAGFLAATLFRGVKYVQMPTSLLAMLDSSVGGKTAVNHARGKNLIGAFHQPSLVICDLAYLRTLPEREYRSALSEAIKCGILGQPALLAWLETSMDALLRRDFIALRHCVSACVQLKAGIIERDPDETGKERILLNLGHTLGHALETLLEGRMNHGEAVAVGLVAAMRVSAKQAGLPAPAVKRVENLLKRAGLETAIPEGVSDADLLRLMGADKKRAGDKLKFIVTPRLGHAVALDVKLDAGLIKDMRGL